MSQSRVTGRPTAVAVLLCLVALAVFGCAPAERPAPRVSPKVVPPAIKTAGLLRVGTDLSYPPFAGVEGDRKAGLDIDVASAMAGRLGLDVEFVDVKASAIATALAAGDIDVALSAPYSDEILTRDAMAGSYVSDGPGLFSAGAASAAVSTQTAVDGDDAKIGAQQGSEAYWALVAARGADGVQAYPTLQDAFDGLSHGDVEYVGADAIVGAYLARDTAGVRYVGALAPAHLLGVAVSQKSSSLADKLRGTLDKLAADGVLDTIRHAWVGSLPRLPLASDDASGAPASQVATP